MQGNAYPQSPASHGEISGKVAHLGRAESLELGVISSCPLCNSMGHSGNLTRALAPGRASSEARFCVFLLRF